MERIFVLLIMLAQLAPSFAQTTGTFTDSRDGFVYKTVAIEVKNMAGDTVVHEWLAQNLRYDSPHSECYKYDDAYCEGLGRLYDWHDAHESCPSGWHVPNFDEWKELFNAYGGIMKAGKELRPGGISKFEAEFGGMADTNNRFYSAGHLANYWDSESHHVTESSGGVISIHYQLDDITHSAVSNKNRNSVRCVKNYEGYDR
ncbi:MAG: FISUMP domain-containing protein [Cyclobacteriaceae bacterium]